MVSRIVNQSVAVVQRFPYLGMFSSVVRWQFFVDLPDVIDGFRGLVSDSLRSGSVPSLLWSSPPLLRLGSLWVCILVRALACQRRQVRSGMSTNWQSLTVRHARLHSDHLEVFETPSRPSVDLFHTLTSKICLA